MKELLKAGAATIAVRAMAVPAPGLIVGGEELADLHAVGDGHNEPRRVSEGPAAARPVLEEERVLPQDRDDRGFKAVVFRIIPAAGIPRARETGIEVPESGELGASAVAGNLE
jgi:hypothetical protein